MLNLQALISGSMRTRWVKALGRSEVLLRLGDASRAGAAQVRRLREGLRRGRRARRHRFKPPVKTRPVVVLSRPEVIGLLHTVMVAPVEKARLTGFLGSLGPEKMREVCRALSVAVGCDG